MVFWFLAIGARLHLLCGSLSGALFAAMGAVACFLFTGEEIMLKQLNDSCMATA